MCPVPHLPQTCLAQTFSCLLWCMYWPASAPLRVAPGPGHPRPCMGVVVWVFCVTFSAVAVVDQGSSQQRTAQPSVQAQSLFPCVRTSLFSESIPRAQPSALHQQYSLLVEHPGAWLQRPLWDSAFSASACLLFMWPLHTLTFHAE